ncbi:hypothetical protein [uncultured Pseudacidovorax sp.]|uniref:hypothetical protein n=1 Tax=uncultured Pseudacidovorax sp. TaxID=679313 RepID=UPI0025E74AA1|nr:hypothetical protein [uncultured Pseudacidovorax sp.]
MWDLLQLSFSTASLVALIYAVWPNLTHKNVLFRKQAWYAMVGFFLLTSALFLWGPTGANSGPLRQSDSIKVSDRSDDVFEVFYPRAFAHAPNLKVRFVRGNGTLEFVEQRADGFKFKTHEVAFFSDLGAEVEWVAAGNVGK